MSCSFSYQVDWCIAIQLKLKNKELIILNIYTSYECPQNEDIYMDRLVFLNSLICKNQSKSVCVVGDMNADLYEPQSLFAKYILQFCKDNNLMLSS